MRTAVGLTALFIGVFLAFLIEMSLPPVHALQGARLVLVPMLFCYAAICLPFPAVIASAIYTGILSDLMYLHIVGGRVEIALGWSIVFFVMFGCLIHGFHPAMQRGKWWPVIPLAALTTSSYLLLQFLMVTLRREGFVFDSAVLWRVFAPGLLAALFTPLLHYGVQFLAQFLPVNSRTVRGY